MCGIAGLWDGSSSDPDSLAAIVRTMRDSIAHRGPDDAHLVVEPDTGVALGHRRLAILDLSPEGRQPMRSPSGRYTIVFNGEVYNHRELRDDLGHLSWRGTSDTETMLAAIERWGLDGALSRFIGMFGLALWDREERALHLVRDRLGIKPVYWGHTTSRALVFGSELRALRAHPEFDRTIDREALSAYFETSCVPAPLSIHRDARKLEPGTIATFRDPRRAPEIRRFWSAAEHFERGARDPLRADDAEVLERVEHALKEAVRMRLLADVPVGAFLSGGIDSSLVVALAQEVSSEPIRTYSIGSADAAYDESGFAAEVARRLGTRHTALTVTGEDALAVVPLLGAMYDEPFADSSQIPTFIVSRLARSEVTVALSGDGGDEVFGGYNRYLWAPRLAALQAVPGVARRAAGAVIERVPASAWDAMHGAMSPPLPRARMLGDKLHKAARALGAESLAGMHASLRRQWWLSPVLGANGDAAHAEVSGRLAPAQALMLRDMLEYLPDDILTKVDRASMAVALEARVPLLDHRVVELAARLPMQMKIRGGKGKWALRELLARRVPREVFERPKTGFSMPVGEWLRGSLRDWAEGLLGISALDAAGLDAPRVNGRWRRHVARREDAGLALWDVLAFRAWEEGIEAPASTCALPRAEVGA